MENKLTELVFILDRSGSMNGLEKDTIGGFNAMIEKQKKEEGNVHVTTVLFNHQVNLLHDRVPLVCVPSLTDKDYQASGMTALLDAVGITIERINEIQQAESKELRAEKVIFVITTDGFENASRKYSCTKLKNLIESQQNELKWEFIFLGANMDAVKEAGKIGIRSDRSASFMNDSTGIYTNFRAIGTAVSAMRSASDINRPGAEWKGEIEKDYKARKNNIYAAEE